MAYPYECDGSDVVVVGHCRCGDDDLLWGLDVQVSMCFVPYCLRGRERL